MGNSTFLLLMTFAFMMLILVNLNKETDEEIISKYATAASELLQYYDTEQIPKSHDSTDASGTKYYIWKIVSHTPDPVDSTKLCGFKILKKVSKGKILFSMNLLSAAIQKDTVFTENDHLKFTKSQDELHAYFKSLKDDNNDYKLLSLLKKFE